MKKNSKDVVTYTEDEIRSDPYGFTLKEITEVLGEQEAQKLFKAPPPNCEKANRCCGEWENSTECPCLCSRRAHKVRLPGNACQPEPSSPVRTAYSVWRSVFADLGIAFFDTGTAP